MYVCECVCISRERNNMFGLHVWIQVNAKGHGPYLIFAMIFAPYTDIIWRRFYANLKRVIIKLQFDERL